MKREIRRIAHFLLLGFCLTVFTICVPAAKVAPPQPEQGIQDILGYISNGWDVLTRSMTKCETVSDPKTGEKSVV
jgi:hypothetical protein